MESHRIEAAWLTQNRLKTTHHLHDEWCRFEFNDSSLAFWIVFENGNAKILNKPRKWMSEHAIHCEKSMRWHFIIIIGYYVTNHITHILIFGQVKKGVCFFLSLTFTFYHVLCSDVSLLLCISPFLAWKKCRFLFPLDFSTAFQKGFLRVYHTFCSIRSFAFLRSVSFFHLN